MQENKKNNNAQITDEALDDMLAQWAEAEIEPPADFHARTMERLRREQQKIEESNQAKQKKDNIIPFFARKKKWMSAAAAAVLVLCCIPVVQAQMGDNNRNPAYDALPGQTQVASNNDVSTENNDVVAGNSVEQKSDLKKAIFGNKADKVQSDTVKQQAAGDKISKGGDTTQQNTAPATTVDASTTESTQPATVPETQPAVIDVPQPASVEEPLAIAAFNLENEEISDGKQVRNVDEALQQAADKAASYKDALTQLNTKLEEVQKDLEEADAKLKAEPDNAALKKEVKDLQDHIDTLKKEIEQMKKLIEEAKAE